MLRQALQYTDEELQHTPAAVVDNLIMSVKYGVKYDEQLYTPYTQKNTIEISQIARIFNTVTTSPKWNLSSSAVDKSLSDFPSKKIATKIVASNVKTAMDTTAQKNPDFILASPPPALYAHKFTAAIIAAVVPFAA